MATPSQEFKENGQVLKFLTAKLLQGLRKSQKNMVTWLTPIQLSVLKPAERHAGVSQAPIISLATAHPSKFPDAVEEASGISQPFRVISVTYMSEKSHMKFCQMMKGL